jgi:hypothetical protein
MFSNGGSGQVELREKCCYNGLIGISSLSNSAVAGKYSALPSFRAEVIRNPLRSWLISILPVHDSGKRSGYTCESAFSWGRIVPAQVLSNRRVVDWPL